MLVKISRIPFLSLLESVQAGLAQRETIEQSTCVVFKNGNAYTYNEEVACTCKSDLPDSIEAAVAAKKLTEMLRKLPEDDLQLEFTDSELIVIGKNRRAGIKLEKHITLNIGDIKYPEKWNKLAEGFAEGVNIVKACAGTDVQAFSSTCIHVLPDYVEAFDQFQVCRWEVKSPIKEPYLVEQKSIRHIVNLGVTKFGETSGWVHFKNEQGLIFSCRRFEYNKDELADFDEAFSAEGKKIVLPKALTEALQRCEIFSSEVVDGNLVTVTLSNGVIQLKAEGITGWFKEQRKVAYSGDTIRFLIAPNMLLRILQQHDECLINDKLLKVDGGTYKYVALIHKEKTKDVDVPAATKKVKKKETVPAEADDNEEPF